MLSLPHLVVIFVIALVVFGPQKLPELARTLGKLMAEFRKASGDFRSAFEEEMRDLERQARETERKLKEAARLPAAGESAAAAEALPSSTVAGTVPGSHPTTDAIAYPTDNPDDGSAGLTAQTIDDHTESRPQELTPRADEAGFADSYHEGEHPDAQPNQDTAHSIAKSNHVDRQPA
jgi:sec-independent protein translocase protein TatB